MALGAAVLAVGQAVADGAGAVAELEGREALEAALHRVFLAPRQIAGLC